MKTRLIAATILALTLGPIAAMPASAQSHRDRDRNDRDWSDFRDDRRNDRDRSYSRWRRGDHVPRDFRGNLHVVTEWRRYGLGPPPRGYRWVRLDGAYVLAGNGWVIAQVVPLAYAGPPRRDEDRDRLWRARYARAYTLDDDPTYTECRNTVDPAGVALGALFGGLLGNAAGGRHDGAGPTIAGVVAGGAIGAALTSKMDCQDRSYAYRTYAEGFNAGRINATYEWRNPNNQHRGRFHVIDYYHDEDDFRCSVYSSTVYIDGRPEEARGRACQQPDGTWAIID